MYYTTHNKLTDEVPVIGTTNNSNSVYAADVNF